MIVIDTFEAVIIAILARLITRNEVTYSFRHDKEFIFIMSVRWRIEGHANCSFVKLMCIPQCEQDISNATFVLPLLTWMIRLADSMK